MRRSKRRFRVLRWILFVLNLALAGALLLSYLSVFIDPLKFWPLVVFGLGYPYFVLANLVFFLIWLLFRRWHFLISLAVMLLGWNFLARYATFNDVVPLEDHPGSFSVLSYNVKNLSNNNIRLEKGEIRNSIFRFISDKQADIVCLQEFMSYGANPLFLFDTLGYEAKLPFYSYCRYKPQKDKIVDALTIFSRFPILSTTEIRKDEIHNFAMYSDILRGSDTIRVFNAHLESFRFAEGDYDFLTEVDLDKTNSDFKEGSRRVLQKLRLAFQKRSEQARVLNEYVAASPYPVILCGDFNDTPVSYTYQQMTRNLDDSFTSSGKGLGNTYSGRLPSFRIDYILYGKGLLPLNFQTSRIELSDHYPISCYFEITD